MVFGPLSDGQVGTSHNRMLSRILGELIQNRLERLTTVLFTPEMIENQSALSGVAFEQLGAMFPSLVAPTPMTSTQRRRSPLA